MNVYRLYFAADDWAGLYTPDRSQRSRLEPFDGTPIAPGWEPIDVDWDNAEGKQGWGDFCEVNGAPVFTARAVEALGDLLEGRGELLPLAVADGGEAYAFNITRLSDALDQDRCELDYYDDGRIMDVDDYVFDPAKVADETIFKLAILPRRFDYVTDRFRDRVEQAGLTGFRWPSMWTGG